MENGFKFPSEIIDLPSKGLLYQEDSSLYNGKIELKYPSAANEDILVSQNLIKKGVAIEKFIESLFVNKNINYGDLLIGDINALMVASRILAYGHKYEAEVTCPSCGNKESIIIDLSKLENKEIEELEEHQENVFEYTLPISGTILKFKLLTHSESKDAENVSKKLSAKLGIDKTLTTKYKQMIISVNGDENKKIINDFSDNMLSKDSLNFRDHINKITPDINMNIDFLCNECDFGGTVRLPLGTNFFWPSKEL